MHLHVCCVNNLPEFFFSSMNSALPHSLALAFVVIDVRSADLSEQRIIFSISSLFAVMSAKLFSDLKELKGLVHTPATNHRFTEQGLMPGQHYIEWLFYQVHMVHLSEPALLLLAYQLPLMSVPLKTLAWTLTTSQACVLVYCVNVSQC